MRAAAVISAERMFNMLNACLSRARDRHAKKALNSPVWAPNWAFASSVYRRLLLPGVPRRRRSPCRYGPLRPSLGKGSLMAAGFWLELPEEVVHVRDWVHEFAKEVIRPAAAEWDEREETPWPIIAEAAKVGLYTPELFAQMAGEPSGVGLLTVFEEMFWGDAGIALSILGTGLAAAALAASGTPEKLGEFLPQMFGSPGDPKVAAFCSSEPGAGSDVGAVRTRARYDEAADEWVLNGTKTWATNGGIADVHIVVASVYPELGTRGQATFVIPPDTEGLVQGQKFKKNGIRASHTAEVVLDNVRVPGELILGGRERFERRIAKIKEGHRTSSQAAMMTFERTRPVVGAMALGIARAAYEYALDYSLQREQFGRKIAEFQAVAFKLADMKSRIDASR